MAESKPIALGSKRSRRPSRRSIFLGLFVTLLTTSNVALAQQEPKDPFESINRAVFDVNLTLDRHLLEPAAQAYRFVTPSPMRTGINNVLTNLGAPLVAANDLLQGEPERATETVGRFMLNTIMGVGGVFDIGGALGMPERHSEDFGQTLATYGVPEGPYLMLPVLGSSNPRDLVGDVVDLVVNPVPSSAAMTAGRTVVSREQNIEAFDELKRSSIDLYAATRTAVRQMRADEIRNGAPADLDDLEDPETHHDDNVN